ncbi:MAG TPA: hypothetical protein VGN17_22710 [Bryobacteraceae bacterium]|jgi:MYXO-CTERM domain-containing protein
MRVIGIAILLTSVASIALAGALPAPEIDASTATAAVGLLAGGLLVLRSRRNKKKS